MARMLIIIAGALLALFAQPAAAAPRNVATGPLVFQVNGTTGVDGNGQCTAAAPCKTINATQTWVRQTFDAACYPVTINVASGVYPEGVQISDSLVGQCGGPAGFTIRGNPGNPASVSQQPTTGPCWGIFYAAMVTVDGFACDQSNNHGNPTGWGEDQVMVTAGGKLLLRSFYFGWNLNPFGDMSVTGSGSNLVIQSWGTVGGVRYGYGVNKPTGYLWASWAAPNSVISVTSCAGVLPNMNVHGVGIPPQTIVQSCVGGTLAISNMTVGAQPSGISITVCACGSHHGSISNTATFTHDTNGGLDPFVISLQNAPTMYAAWYVVSKGGIADLGQNFSGPSGGYQFLVSTNGILNSGAQGIPGLPGDVTSPPPTTGGQVQ